MKRKIILTLTVALSVLFSPILSPALAGEEGGDTDVASVYTETADLAKEYVAKSYDAWGAKSQASQARLDSIKAEEDAVEAKEEYSSAFAEAKKADEEYEIKRQISVNFMRDIMKDPSLNISPAMQAVTMSAGDAFGLAQGMKQVENINDTRAQAAQESSDALLKAEQAQERAEKLSDAADAAEQKSQDLLEEAKAQDVKSSGLLQDARNGLSQASSDLNNSEIKAGIKEDLPASQRVLTEAVTEEWEEYKKVLSSSEDLLPDQNQTLSIFDDETSAASRAFRRGKPSTQVPAIPLFNEDGTVQVGASKKEDGTLLLSKPAIKRVQMAMDYLGTPYSDMTCNALISEVSGYEKTKDLDALFSSAYQNKSISDTLPGDIVFFADAHGLSQAGVSIGGGLVIASSASSRSVIVVELNDSALVSTRPGVDYSKSKVEKAPTSSNDDTIAWECGGIASSFGSVSGGAWVLPYGERDYDTSLSYGDTDKRFKDKTSPGIIFSAKSEDVVQSAFAGAATVTKTKKRGTTVSLRYNESLTVRYSGLSKVSVTDGTFIGVGDPIGTTGNTGSLFKKDKAPGVFVEVLVNDETVDPEFMFFPPEDAGSSGYPNGLIPAEILCPLDIGSHKLRCDAAQGFAALNVAYEAEFGKPISLTDSYRTLASQKVLKKQKPVLAATPGKSNHGWGLALDLGGGINNFDTKEHIWMIENSSLYGWEHPNWARKGGGMAEPWHFEFASAVK